MKALTLLFLITTLPLLGAEFNQTFTWDRNPEPDIAGYVIHYGTVSRGYTQRTNVGNIILATVRGLTLGRTNYVALTAVNTSGLESEFSNEVAVYIAATRPRNLLIVTDLEWAPAPLGPWSQVYSVTYPIREETNKFYRLKLSTNELPPAP